MDQNEILEALNEISDTYILEAATPPRKKALTLRRGIAFAAAVAAVLALALGVPFWSAGKGIVTAPGVIKVSAETTEAGTVTEVVLHEDIPYHIVNHAGANFPGIRFTLSAPETATGTISFHVSTPLGYVAQLEDFRYTESVITVPNNTVISYSIFRMGDHISEDIERFEQENPSALYVRIIMLEDGNIIGYSVVRIDADTLEAVKLLRSISFPLQNGKHQNITMRYVNDQMDAVIENHH